MVNSSTSTNHSPNEPRHRVAAVNPNFLASSKAALAAASAGTLPKAKNAGVDTWMRRVENPSCFT